jgi:AAA domain
MEEAYGELTSGAALTVKLPLAPLTTAQQDEKRDLVFRPFSHLTTLPAEPDWLWRGYLAPGMLTMLAGHPFAGKSMLVGGILKALEEGASFLGQSTTRTTAAVVTEEDMAVLRGRAEALDLLGLRSTFVDRASGSVQVEWPLLIARASRHAIESGHRLLVVDTFPGLAGLHGEEENDAGAIAERLLPLQRAAAEGLAVLFLHHMNGQSQPRGSKAFRGIVDMSIRFIRQGKAGGFRLESESRFPTATPIRLEARLVQAPDGWFYVQAGGAAPKKEVTNNHMSTDARLQDVLAQAGPAGLTYTEIDDIPGLSQDQAKKRFPAWYRENKIDRRGSGSKTNPYRWIALSD